MVYDLNFGWNGAIGRGNSRSNQGRRGTRKISYRIGGGTTLPFLDRNPSSPSPLVALEICDNPEYWSPIINNYCGDLVNDVHEWAKAAETIYKADLVRLYLTSTRQRNFSDISSVGKTVEAVLSATGLPLIIEGSNEPKIDSEVFLEVW
ncbi:MAG: hypothetical protein MZU84_02880 [Sphingobacterium sp.]|nr:hypothetical protein [Sphingobacterium sp.]